MSGILRTADAFLIVLDLTEDPDVQAELIIEQLRKWNIQLSTLSHERQTSSRVVKKALLVGNKNDIFSSKDGFKRLKERYGYLYPCISVSAFKKDNLEELKREIFSITGVIRVYSKPPGKEPDFSMPFTIPEGSTVLDLAESIHKDFVHNLRYARIWGSAKFDGQRVEKNYILKDKDIVEFHVS